MTNRFGWLRVVRGVLGLSVMMVSLFVLPSAKSAEKADGFLQREGRRLFLHGREYRAIGVNMPFAARNYTLGRNAEKTDDFVPRPLEDVSGWLKEASESGFAFIRFFGYPQTPAEIQWYLDHKETYWKGMDEFMELCRKLNIALVPSLGMYPHFHYRRYTGEHNPAILDSKSRMHQLVYGYVTEMVTRYKDDPNILMWEITNEGFLKADVLPAGGKDPEDRMSFAQFQQLYLEAAAHIKSLDRNHLVMSGDACPRPESMSNRLGRRSQMDSLRDHLADFLASQPEPLDVISIHAYVPMREPDLEKQRHWKRDKDGYKLLPGNLWASDYAIALVRCAHAAQMPVIVGELGQSLPYFDQSPSSPPLLDSISRMEEEGVSLIALWVWNLPTQPEYTFNSSSKPDLVKRAAAFNRKYGSLPKAGGAVRQWPVAGIPTRATE